MNILIVTAMFPPTRTGTSFYSKNLAKTLQNQGHCVTVVTVENNEILNENFEFKIERIKALHINLKNFFKHLRFTSIYFSNYLRLKKIAKENNSDVILLVNHYLDIAFPAIFISKLLKLPLYISVGTQMQSLNPFRNKILRFFDRLICGNMIFPYCEKIISWDSEIERYIYEVQKSKIAKKSVIIPFGANGHTDELYNYNPNYELSNVILGVGAIISQRDYLFQIRVFKELLNFNPKLKLKIVGHIYIESPLFLAKELGVTENIEFLGEINHDEVLKLMKEADLHWMMLSGEYVGLGTATIEAMLMGIPCISNVPNNLFGEENKLIDMEHYIFTDSQKIDIIVEKVNQFYNDKSIRETIGVNGKNFVNNFLNWDSVGQKIINLFNN
jgi:glycosyltransferase involved in cell wall biosynthesis